MYLPIYSAKKRPPFTLFNNCIDTMVNYTLNLDKLLEFHTFIIIESLQEPALRTMLSLLSFLYKHLLNKYVNE